MTSGSVSALHLATIFAAPAVARGVRLGVDGGEEARTQVERRDQQPLRGEGRGVAGQHVEHAGHFGGEAGIRGQQSHVLVGAGGGGVVIARPDVDVLPQHAALAAHHEAELGMRLQAGQAMHHVAAGALQHPCPGDVVGLLEARLQLHHHHDLLPGARRGDEGVDDRIGGGAVEGLLDGQHPGIGRRLLDERLDAAGERLVGVVEQDLAVLHAPHEAPGRRPGGRDGEMRGLAQVGDDRGGAAPTHRRAPSGAGSTWMAGVARDSMSPSRWTIAAGAVASTSSRTAGASGRAGCGSGMERSRSAIASSSIARSASRVTRKAWRLAFP